MRVGIVERNRKNLELMVKFFGKNGHSTISATRFEEFERLRDADVVFIDIAGFDSRIWDLCEELREKEIPFVLIYPKRVEKVDAKGAEAVLFKPLSPEKILGILRELGER